MTRFNFDVITLFPKAFELINNLGVITRALDKNLINVSLHDLREYGEGNYRQVDDKPYGGGSGMVFGWFWIVFKTVLLLFPTKKFKNIINNPFSFKNTLKLL